MNAEHSLLLGNLAQDYYFSKMPINKMVEKYSLSRYLILKYLDEALTNGIVEITIHSNYERSVELEQKLKEKFNIDHLYVIQDPENLAKRDDRIAAFAATQVQAIIQHCKFVALAWGETVFEVIDHFVKVERDDLRFVQFMGENMKYRSSTGSMRMVQRAASKYNAQYYTIPGPLYIINDKIREGFIKEPSISRALRVAEKTDLLLCGIGTIESVHSIPLWHEHETAIFPNVNLENVTGMIFGRPYDINGNFLNQASDKTLSLSLEKIKNIPRRFGIVQGKSKYKATLGALRGGFFTDLVINEATAIRILNELK